MNIGAPTRSAVSLLTMCTEHGALWPVTTCQPFSLADVRNALGGIDVRWAT